MTRLLRFRRDGLTFDVGDEGPLDGEPVVLLHGFPERRTCWRDVVPLLHPHGLRTYAPDQRGYSPGARPDGRRAYLAKELVADAVALIESIGRPVHLVGHDWGSAIAWSLAGVRPDLVRTLTAVSVPHPSAFARAAVTSRQGLKSWYMGAFQVPGLAERAAARRGGRAEQFLARSGMTPADLRRFRTEIVEYGALPGALAWYRALPLSRSAGSARRITVPTTLVWSDRDGAIDRAGVEASERYVDASYELVVLSGVDHWIPTHAPVALAEAILERVVTP